MAAGEAGRNHPAHRSGRRQRRRRASYGEDAAGSEARDDTDPRRQQAWRKPGALRRVSRAASERPAFPAAGYIDALHQSDTGIDAGAVRRLSGARAGVHRLQRVHGVWELAVQDNARSLARLKAEPDSVAFSVVARGGTSHAVLAAAARAGGADPKRLKLVVYKTSAEATTAL